MSFMAGFGPAFSEGIKKNQELREQRKDDAFKLTFAEFSRSREKRDNDKKEDQLAIRKAKAYASAKNPEAWPKVYEWVKAGLSDDEIQKRMEGDFQVGPKDPKAPAVAEAPKAPTGPAESAMLPQPGQDQDPMVAQTAASGLAGPAQPAQVAEPNQNAPSAAPVKGKLLTDVSGKFGGAPARAQAKVAPQTGNVAPAVDAAKTANDPTTDRMVAPAAAPASSGGGVMDFMRGAFGNGSGVQSRTEHISTAKDSIGAGLGLSREEVDDVFAGYTPEQVESTDIRWTPAKGQVDPDKINTLEEAQIELDNANASKDPERIAIAQRRVNSVIQAGKIKAEQAADAQGLTVEGKYVNIFGPNPAGGPPIWKGTVKVKETPEGLVDAVTGDPVDPQNAVPMDKREWEERDKLSTRSGKEVQEYRTALDNHIGLVSGIGALDRTYQEMPGALQEYSSGAAKIAQDVANEVAEGFNLLDRATDKQYSSEYAVETLEKQAQALQERVNKSDNYVSKLANASALAETQKALLTYRLAATLGQTGRNLAETERMMIQKGFDASNYTQFRSKAASLLKQANGTIERQAESVRSQTKGFEDTYKYTPYEVQIETPKERLANVDEKSDPDLALGKLLLDGSGKPQPIDPDAPAPQQTPEAAPAAPEKAPGQYDLKTVDPKIRDTAIERLRKGLVTPAQFDEKFGTGAAAGVLTGGQ